MFSIYICVLSFDCCCCWSIVPFVRLRFGYCLVIVLFSVVLSFGFVQKSQFSNYVLLQTNSRKTLPSFGNSEEERKKSSISANCTRLRHLTSIKGLIDFSNRFSAATCEFLFETDDKCPDLIFFLTEPDVWMCVTIKTFLAPSMSRRAFSEYILRKA